MKIYLIERDYQKFMFLKAYFEQEDVELVNDGFENFMKKRRFNVWYHQRMPLVLWTVVMT